MVVYVLCVSLITHKAELHPQGDELTVGSTAWLLGSEQNVSLVTSQSRA